jgi:hypothetical protein
MHADVGQHPIRTRAFGRSITLWASLMERSAHILATLEATGLLLIQDRSFPNVVKLVTGETLRGSWWAHPRSHEIFRCLNAIAADPAVLVTKLIHKKVTFVHRRLWPAVLSVASARDAWQLEGLSPEASLLLDQVEREGQLEASGPESAELEHRLLVHGEQIHTESGKHKTRLETWAAWSRRLRCGPPPPPKLARTKLETCVRDLGFPVDSLPWLHRKRKLESSEE